MGIEEGPEWLTKRDVLSPFEKAGAAGRVEFLSEIDGKASRDPPRKNLFCEESKLLIQKIARTVAARIR